VVHACVPLVHVLPLVATHARGALPAVHAASVDGFPCDDPNVGSVV
jgi:hypothetical protein